MTSIADQRTRDFFHRRGDVLERMASKAAGGSQRADYDDLLQEARLKVFRVYTDTSDAQDGYVIKCVQNHLIDAATKQIWSGSERPTTGHMIDPLRRRGSLVSIDAGEPSDTTTRHRGNYSSQFPGNVWWERPDVRRNEPAEEFEAAMAANSVRNAVAGLPDRQRENVRLRFWEDLTVDQIARRMGVGRRTVTTDWRERALPALQSSLAHLAVA